jgi:nitroimidazol reductase NimA-like FMN-containing flavoprotein (pyridoxamine 5'-phosphate oxidase superfamily)
MNEEGIASFLTSHGLMVISSYGEEYPESAVVEYANDNCVLVFDTDSSSRKYKNIVRNPNVSVVVGWDNDVEEETLQYEGKCTVLEGEELTHYKKVYFAKNPGAQKWENEPDTAYLKVEPVWVRHTDLKVFPWKISELQF